MPNRIAFTQAAIDRLKPPAEGRVTYWDRYTPGFGLRISAPRPGSKDARRTWIAMGRVDGKPVMTTLGTTATIPKVDRAREAARAAILKMRAGTKPLEERKAEQARRAAAAKVAAEAARAAVEGQFGKVVERFLTERGRAEGWAAKYAGEVERIFRHDILPRWGEKHVAAITTADVEALLRAKAATRERSRKGTNGGATTQANRTLLRLATFFRWAIKKKLIAENPTEGIEPLIKERARDRVLIDNEIIWFWRGAERAGWPFAEIFRLLLLTAQREGEVSGMRWSEVDLQNRLWTIPKERNKSGRQHIVYLSELAVEIIGTLPRIGGDLVFPTKTGNQLSSFSRAKDRLDALMTAQRREATGKPDAELPAWVIHDLRRTAATVMAEQLKVAPHVVDKILNHATGTIRGVAAIYNRGEYADERKAALEALGRWVAALVRPSGAGNVIPLTAARA